MVYYLLGLLFAVLTLAMSLKTKKVCFSIQTQFLCAAFGSNPLPCQPLLNSMKYVVGEITPLALNS